jgi:hypothetical protein
LDYDDNSVDKAYDVFIKNFITYQELFDNSSTPSDILELPYCLFVDLIDAQTKRKKELEKYRQKEIDNIKKQRQAIPSRR